MNNLEQTEKQLIEVENQYWRDMLGCLTRLEKHPDFQKLILEGYFKDKAVDGVSLLARDDIVQTGKRSQVMEDLIGVSSLQDHFITIKNLGYVPTDEELEELNQE